MNDCYEIVETCALDEHDASQYSKPWLLVAVDQVREFDTEDEAINVMKSLTIQEGGL